MKRKLKPSEKETLKFLKQAAAERTLQPLLSPLENAALRHNGKPFQFDYDGLIVYISDSVRQQIIHNFTFKVHLMRRVIDEESKKKYIPVHLREVFDDPREILSLHYYVRNRLCKMGCYTMYSVMTRGRHFFLEEEGFGQKSMRILDDLFKKHGCSHLFS